MSKYTIYHNPRCSKSRQTLEILLQQGIDPEVVRYLDEPPTAEELHELLSKLGMTARDLLRKGEQEYRELGLADGDIAEAQLVEAMAEHPKLIERPIVVSGTRAVLGRPPENVLELIGNT